MKWVGCINHNLQHDTSEKPSETPTSAMWLWNQVDISVGLHDPNEHWPLATVAGAETHYICSNLLWVWSGWGASIITYRMIQCQNPTQSLTPPMWLEDSMLISVWDCILVTTGCVRATCDFLNTLRTTAWALTMTRSLTNRICLHNLGSCESKFGKKKTRTNFAFRNSFWFKFLIAFQLFTNCRHCSPQVDEVKQKWRHLKACV